MDEAVRKTFNDETFERCKQFAADLLMLIPELEALTIVPSWVTQQEHLSVGVVMGRNGPLTTPAELMHMSMQMHQVLRILQDNAILLTRQVDAKMKAQAEELRDYRDRLDETPPAGGGATPDNGGTAAGQ